MSLYLRIENNKVIEDIDYLVNILYTFLETYVPLRLLYEDKFERDNCIQDTMLYLIKRYNELSKEEKENEDLGKFFYNRCRSYISNYINKLKLERKNSEALGSLYIEQVLDSYYEINDSERSIIQVDYELVNTLLNTLILDRDDKKKLKDRLVDRIKNFYLGSIKSTNDIEIEDNLDSIVIMLLDSYLSYKAVEKSSQN